MDHKVSNSDLMWMKMVDVGLNGDICKTTVDDEHLLVLVTVCRHSPGVYHRLVSIYPLYPQQSM